MPTPLFDYDEVSVGFIVLCCLVVVAPLSPVSSGHVRNAARFVAGPVTVANFALHMTSPPEAYPEEHRDTVESSGASRRSKGGCSQ